jgi:hypothetical protein
MALGRRIWQFVKRKLHLSIAVSVLAMITVMAFSFVSSWRKAHDEAYGLFYAIEMEVAERIGERLKKYETTAARASYSRTVQEYLLSKDPETVIYNSRTSDEAVQLIFDANRECKNIYLWAPENRYLFANRTNIEEIRRLVSSALPGEVKSPLFTAVPDGKNRESAFLFYLYPVYNTLMPGSKNTGLCVIECDMKDITDFPVLGYVDNLLSFPEGVAVIFFGDSIVSRSREISEDEYAIFCKLQEGRTRQQTKSGFFVCQKVSFTEGQWSFVYILKEEVLYREIFSRMNNGLIWLCLAMTALIIFLSSWQKRLDAVVAQARSDFLSYRSQINPHFLFNSLESMRSLAHSSGDGRLETMIMSMTRMFRYSLETGPLVPLEKEFTHAVDYIGVMNIRFEKGYHLSIDAAPDISSRLVPSMILQPIVENSVKHGFIDGGGGGGGRVKIFRKVIKL